MNNEILVDACDAALLTDFNWSIKELAPGYFYACRSDYVDGKRAFLFLHRVILMAAKGQFVDHINGNGLDCRRSNIRICSHAENMRNRKVSKSNKLGVKGVYLDGRKFRAEIKSHGVRHHLGRFDSLEMARKTYDEAAKRLHQEFARPN